MNHVRSAHHPARRKLAIAMAAAIVLALLIAAPLAGAAGNDALAFTEAQVEAGAAVFAQSCSFCHGAALEGLGSFPVLAGTPFQERWADRPLGELYVFVRENMPLGAGGSLDPATYAALVALILARNGVESGDAAFDPADEAALGVVLTFGE